MISFRASIFEFDLNMLYPRFKKALTERCRVKPGDALIVGVSGGIDSMVLLDLIARAASRMKLPFTVAHVHYGLRGRASDADCRLVEERCKALSVPCEVLRCRPAKGKNLQDEARRIRMRFFEKLAHRHGAAIVTAHHRGDQAETVLIHLLRGAGLSGLAGMQPRTATGETILLRPLLDVSRDEIARYARRQKIAFREDATNRRTHYRRNLVRHRVLPLLAEINPRIEEHLSALAARLADDDRALDAVASVALEEALRPSKGERLVLKRASLSDLPRGLGRRVLRLAFARAAGTLKDLSADQLARMDAIISSPKREGRYRLPARWAFFRSGEEVRFERQSTRCDRR